LGEPHRSHVARPLEAEAEAIADIVNIAASQILRPHHPVVPYPLPQAICYTSHRASWRIYAASDRAGAVAVEIVDVTPVEGPDAPAPLMPEIVGFGRVPASKTGA
jgi:hypothetical protein